MSLVRVEQREGFARAGGPAPMPGQLRVGVALCTYNGASYVGEQLRSIAAQTRQPDRLVVVDDGSTDDTLRLVEEFAARAPFAVEVRRNERNLGYAKNFERAVSLVDTDVVALSDQDDVWTPHKLERMTAAFAEHPEVGLVFSDAEVVDASLRPLGFRLWESVRFTPDRQREAREGRLFETLLRGSVVTGAASAFRTSLLRTLLPIPERVPHDAWMALLAAAIAPARLLPEPLLLYRQHGRNQIGTQRLGGLARLRRARSLRQAAFVDQLAHFRAARERLAGVPGVSPDRLMLLCDAAAHVEQRVRLEGLGRARRVPIIARELARGRYATLGQGWKSAVRDLII